jgi:hypothetical protein
MQKFIEMRFPEGVNEQNRVKAHSNVATGPRHQHERGPGLAKSPHAKGGG